MNFFRATILCIMVLFLATLSYVVVVKLDKIESDYKNYKEAEEAENLANKEKEQAAPVEQVVPAQPQQSASEQAYEKTMEDQEYDILAQGLKKQSEQNAELKTEDTLIGKVTEVASADAGGYLILKLAFDTYTLKGESKQVGEGTKLYVACSNGCYLEVTVSPTMDRANKEFLAYVTEGSFNVPAGLGVEPPTPQVGDGVFYWSKFHDIPQKPTF